MLVGKSSVVVGHGWIHHSGGELKRGQYENKTISTLYDRNSFIRSNMIDVKTSVDILRYSDQCEIEVGASRIYGGFVCSAVDRHCRSSQWR